MVRSWNVKIQTDDLAIATPVKLMDVSGKSSSSLSWADIVEGNRSRDGMVRGTDLALGSMGDDGSNRSKPNGMQLGFPRPVDDELEISLDDVVDERRCWEHSLIGYIGGDRVPFAVMKGFVENHWKNIVCPEVYSMIRDTLCSGLLTGVIGRLYDGVIGF